MRKEGRKLLLLDTGNLFFRKPLQTETKRKDAILRAELLVQSYNEMGYDAVNVGEKDLLMGSRFLLDITQKARFPLISANLVTKNNHTPVFKPYLFKEVSGLKIGIFGLLDDYFSPAIQEKDPNLTILDPLSTSKAITKKLREECDLIVLLSQLGESGDRRLARENSQIDLILGGGGDALKPVIDRINEIPIYRLEPRGGYLGRIDYVLVNTKRPIKFSISSERDEIEKRLERLISRIIQIKSEMASSKHREETKLKELKFLETRQKQLEQTLLAFEKENFYRHIAIPVQLSIEDDPKIMRGVEQYRLESAKLYTPKTNVIPEKGLSEKEMLARIPKDSPYVGAINCKKCHETNYQKWLKTKHAKASQTIMTSPKYAQEECLICHSTGYGKMGEYVTIDDVPFYLRGVQCEACHGPGKGHPEKGKIVRKVTLGVCRNCHTKDQSPAFNYLAYIEKIGCKISN